MNKDKDTRQEIWTNNLIVIWLTWVILCCCSKSLLIKRGGLRSLNEPGMPTIHVKHKYLNSPPYLRIFVDNLLTKYGLSWDENCSSLLLGHWYEIMALYFVKSILTEILASRQDRRVLQKIKIIRIEFLSKWGMLQTSRYV